ncbi:hypothetical protein D7X12_40985 [Corallococcus sicarius]|uniref:Uncharacterized protein n=1 Tax=Corallococcus sicarius TaxID=2316726 RepID=A0A3A8M661_9BACT|nr:hypothetical protein D7X12_40985 [Corallococcus sicarius]
MPPGAPASPALPSSPFPPRPASRTMSWSNNDVRTTCKAMDGSPSPVALAEATCNASSRTPASVTSRTVKACVPPSMSVVLPSGKRAQ